MVNTPRFFGTALGVALATAVVDRASPSPKKACGWPPLWPLSPASPSPSYLVTDETYRAELRTDVTGYLRQLLAVRLVGIADTV
jgi:hypothetical protein